MDFLYTDRLSAAAPNFTSDWVQDVYYANSQEFLLETKDGNWYLYRSVGRENFDNVVKSARGGWSVGAAVNDVKHVYGPGQAFPQGVNVAPASAKAASSGAPVAASAPALPDAVRTEVQFLDERGQVKFMKSTKPADEALSDYLASTAALGLKFELEAVHIYFK